MGSNGQCDRKHISIGLACCWMGSEWAHWYKCRWYNGVDGGYGCADTNANGERPREFDGEMTLTVTNNCFKRITVNW